MMMVFQKWYEHGPIAAILGLFCIHKPYGTDGGYENDLPRSMLLGIGRSDVAAVGKEGWKDDCLTVDD